MENDLHGNLDAANRDCAVGRSRPGVEGFLLRSCTSRSATLFAEINEFNASPCACSTGW